MLPQTIALCAAIAYAFSFILSKRGMHHSTPITVTFVSLLVQTVALFTIVFAITGIPTKPCSCSRSSLLPVSCKRSCVN